MVHAILLCCALFGDGGKPPEKSATDRVAYDAAKAKAGKSPAALVQLALWCEAHGLTAERMKHLSDAVALDPSNVLARSLLGLVSFQGKWSKPADVEQGTQNDPKFQAVLREYLDRRVRTPRKPDAQLHLAAWCLEHGLKEQAMAHYFGVTRLDPSRDIAWIKLGYKKHRNRWVKADDLAAAKLEGDRQKHADTQWKPRLEKLRDGLESKLETRRLKAEKELYQITDPRAVPMIWKVFGNGSEPMQLVAVEVLSQIEGPTASFFLAALALEKPSPEVRQRAARALAHRDPRDVIGWLINLIHKPFKYEVKPGQSPGSAGELMVDGERFDLRRFYRTPTFDTRLMPPIDITLKPASFDGPGQFATPAQAAAMFSIARGIQSMMTYQWAQLTAEGIEQAQDRADDIRRSLYADVDLIEQANAQINESNERLLPLLETLTGQRLGTDPEKWRKWWAEKLGYAYQSRYPEDKPSLSETVEVPDVSVSLPVISVGIQLHHACFGAGTLVQTIDGPRKIETIQAGDRVLSQNPSTGALSFKPVLASHLNGPAETFRIGIEGETVVATGIHRFWIAGKGWTMARDLKPGDRLRMVGGIVSIQSIEPDATQMVYNLSVAENRDFLVGNAGLLVHDYSFVLPISEPFDRQTALAPAVPR